MIESLRLRNFKAFADQELRLGPLTLLAGLNSTGKSTVLQALGLLRQSFDAGMLPNEGFLLNGDLVVLGTGDDVLHEDHMDAWITLSIVDEAGSGTWSAAYSREADVLPIHADAGHPLRGTLFGQGFQYLRADRLNPAVTYPKSHHAVRRRHFLGSRGEFAAHYLSQFQNEPVEQRRQHPRIAATPGLLAQVSAWMQDLAPGVGLDVHEVERTDFVRLSYHFGRSAGIKSGGPYRPTNVGFGLSYALPVVIACLAMEAGGLLLLENPEAHLHPGAQVALGQLLAIAAAAGVQVVVESHSDHVLNAIRLAVKHGVLPPESARIHFFSRGLDGATQVETPRVGADGRMSAWPDGFFDQWDRSLDELLG